MLVTRPAPRPGRQHGDRDHEGAHDHPYDADLSIIRRRRSARHRPSISGPRADRRFSAAPIRYGPRGDGGVTLRRREEAGAEATAEVVPGRDPLARLGAQRLLVDAEPDRVRVRGGVVADPAERVGRRDLGVELDAPRALADPEGLHAGVAGGEGRRARRRQALVAVPLVRLEARAQMREERVALAGRVSRTSRQPISGSRARRTSPPAARASSCAPRQTPSTGIPAESSSARNAISSGDPGVRVGLIDVHRAAEGDHGAVSVPSAGEVVRLGSMPHVELGAGIANRLGEHAGPGITLVADREHPHTVKFRRAARGSDEPAVNVHAHTHVGPCTSSIRFEAQICKPGGRARRCTTKHGAAVERA